jgi:hypothetical protein
MRRLRDYPEPAELAQMYAAPHDGSCGIHQERIALTIALGRKWFGGETRVTDLSCGAEAQIPRGLDATRVQLGDLAPGFEFTGPLHETITQCRTGGLFVFSETLEHLDDPFDALASIRGRFDRLLLSTPWVGEDEQDGNPEHVWAMDPIDVAWMLEFTGWKLGAFEVFDARPHAYRWQIWGAVA